MLKLSEIREKEIININSGERMGFVEDFEIDLEKGVVKAIIMGRAGKVLSLFSKNNDIIIDWKNIVKIGADIILVDFKNEISD